MTAEQVWERAIGCMLTELSVKEVEAYGAEQKAQGYREGVEAVLRIVADEDYAGEFFRCVQEGTNGLLKGAQK